MVSHAQVISIKYLFLKQRKDFFGGRCKYEKEWVEGNWVMIRCIAQHNADMPRLTTMILSEKCVVRQFSCCANFIECTDTNLDIVAYYISNLCGIDCCS